MRNQGQIALIMLTVMAVTLTLGLSLSKRVVEDVSLTRKKQESEQAFSAAESGVEEALRRFNQDGSLDSFTLSEGDIGADVSIDINLAGGENDFVYPQQVVSPGETAVVWLRDHDSDGNLDFTSGYGDGGATEIDVCWANNAAMEIICFYDAGSNNYEIRQYAYDQDLVRRTSTGGETGGNNFSDFIDTSCAGLDHGVTVDLTDGTPLFLVLRPFYEDSQVGVSGSEALPGQGFEIYSTGQIDQDEETKVSRRIRVFKSWSVPGQQFLGSIFSGTGISGN